MPSIHFVVRVWSEDEVLGLIRLKTREEAVEILGSYAGSAYYRDVVPVYGPVLRPS